MLPSLDPLSEPPSSDAPPFKYVKVQDLSRGAFGFVQLCRHTEDGELYAIKFMERGDKINEYVEWEILNHRSLYHPHVIDFKEVFLTKHHLAIVMEFAPGGDLCRYVNQQGRLTEISARWFFQQLIIGLDYCHKKNVICRDIKLENTLLDASQAPQLKICDFGMSKNSELQSLPGTRLGTMAYMAPEIIGAGNHMVYDGKIADVWSSGVMLYTMLIGDFPFGRQSNAQQMKLILAGEYTFPEDIPLTDSCKDLLRKILVTRPEDRITINQIVQHPWFLTNMPEGAVGMNDDWLSRTKDGLQSEEEIRGLVRDARVVLK